MKEYVIVGTDALLTDIFDIIHATGGKVAAVYQNMKPTPPKRGLSIQQRIDMLDYSVELYDSLETFSPTSGYTYIQGLNSVQKYKMIEELKERFDLTFGNLIHPEAYLGSNVTIGEGAFVNAKATIAPNAYLDDFCSINRSAVVGHDAYVGKYTRLGPAVSLAGATLINDKCSIGIGATILDYVEIGEWSVIGAGSVVTKDIPKAQVAYGIPAKIVKENDVCDFSAYIKKRSR
jgi:sugar O-acyltransferase (sialic acid O-acetyltransferase NeuD family)